MRILNRPMFRYGGPIKEGIMHGMQNGGRIGFKDGPKKKKYKLEEAPIGKFGNWLGDKAVPGGIYYGLGTPIQTLYDMAAVPANTAARLFGYNPGLSGTKFVDTLTGGNFSKFTGFDRDKALGTSAKEGWTTPSMQEGPTAAELELEALKKKIAAQTKGDKPENLGLEPSIDPNKAKKLAKQKQNERLKSYLDMMGYDSAKKGALSDALIDASALVQDATTEAGSIKHADWGKLINRMIQTTSKRLDKPEQIREAVGLMMTKGEIEKDLEDPAVAKLRLLKIKESEKALEGSKGSSIGELIPTVTKNLQKTRVDAEVMKTIMSIKEPDTISTIVGKKDDLQDIKDASDFTTIEDYIATEYRGKEGIYIIDNVVVQIDANGVPDRLY